MACYSIAPCGECEGCLAIKAMPPWQPEDDCTCRGGRGGRCEGCR